MKSLDTNVLVYATNRNSGEHAVAKEIYAALLEEPQQWIVADQVLFEFYRALRSPRVLEKPQSAKKALQQIRFLREEAGCRHCAYSPKDWREVSVWLERPTSAARHIFDTVLAVTLKTHGVKEFFTYNAKDFRAFKFFDVIVPGKSV